MVGATHCRLRQCPGKTKHWADRKARRYRASARQQRIAIKTDLSACPVLCAYISGKAVVPLRPLECGAT